MSVPRWIRVGAGPVLVIGLVLGGLLGSRYFPEKEKTGAAAIGQCGARPDAVRKISDEPILTKAPRPDRFGDVDSGEVSCTAQVAMAAVTRPLSGSVEQSEVLEFYRDLAESSGWHSVDRGDGIYAATKDADGGCPWWFVMRPAEYGYQLKVIYLPSGASADQCGWK